MTTLSLFFREGGTITDEIKNEKYSVTLPVEKRVPGTVVEVNKVRYLNAKQNTLSGRKPQIV
jgi:hypothetical protein